jgi:ATP-dependent RNA helicase DeaD
MKSQDPLPIPSFSELSLPEPLAQAIAARGYEKATAVQAAVAGPENAGRDLLVSSETGSGKTLAFGIALAEGLLDQAPARAPGATGPRALIITPTRELATQVRTELQWLYARTKVKLGVFTGGTHVRSDLAVLRPGLDLVVGTPGRLCDLLKRKSLRLESVRTVVLDEADEMLDMGFREDLETLLSARAAVVAGQEDRTRTLMFSATLPQTILSMAARYQHNALRIDARTRQGGSAVHQDISYVAHLVAMGERVPAVVNVLRRNRGLRAIVFGTTRDGVADLHQQLVNRGFRAVVLSGDRAQAERTRSLTALRKGESDILVATNVAARGLDLPEVDLVVHADLPLNAEALTHRSGRTGRAGRKGTSVLIATLADRRKAERLLGNARVPFTWTAAPSERDIARAAEEDLATTLVAAATESDAPEAGDARELAARLVAEADRDALLVALLRRELARMPSGERLTEVDLRARSAPPSKLGPRPSRGDFSRVSVLFEVNLGASQKAEPGWLLPLICRRGGITRHEVGAIRVGPQSSQFEIAGDAAEEFALAAGQSDPRAPHVRILRLDGGSRGGPPRRADGPPRPRFDRRDAPPPARFERADVPPPAVEPQTNDRPEAPPTAKPHAKPHATEAAAHAKPAHVEAPPTAKPPQVNATPAPHATKAHQVDAAPHKKAPHADAPSHKKPPRADVPSSFKKAPRIDVPSSFKKAPRIETRSPYGAPRRADGPPHGKPPRADGPRSAKADGKPGAPIRSDVRSDVRSGGHGAWRPPARQPQPGPHKAGNRRPPRPR